MKKLKIKIIRDLCIGAGTCIVQAPGTFEFDKDSIAVIKNPKGNTVEEIIAAAKSCPTFAIILYDGDTGKQIWPEAKK